MPNEEYFQKQIDDLQKAVAKLETRTDSIVNNHEDFRKSVKDSHSEIASELSDLKDLMITEERLKNFMTLEFGKLTKSLLLAIFTLGGTVLAKWISEHF